jgi:two-component system response regulator QseB
MRLLLTEDDPMIGESVEQGLRDEHYAVDCIRAGNSAQMALAGMAYDLILPVLSLPKKSGLNPARAAPQQRARAEPWSPAEPCHP